MVERGISIDGLIAKFAIKGVARITCKGMYTSVPESYLEYNMLLELRRASKR